MSITTKSGRKVRMPTAAEDAEINAGIASDPDAPEVSDAFFKSARPAKAVLGSKIVDDLVAQRRPRGRPAGSTAASTKVPVTVRVDPDVLEALRSTGAGWQTRVNDLLRREFVPHR